MSKPLIIVAHLALVLATPYWIFVVVFAPLVMGGQVVPVMSYLLLGLLYLGPVASLICLVVLWGAIWKGRKDIAHGAAWGLIFVQLGAGILAILS
ncbi:hypothetical protein [Cohaesibacter gelatinilyticus]|uniref:Uncharacterized protein n=1 Tax=Cohaesibacter gelatinilyticus TaxID=372072 RepID=A0A285PCB6_9HYPH|nr:hypothetical protein [Cohaesibacter gelatinilyticus]SNZ19390.1 hypothetical protein SAMN06265368_2475 [Cohaesibacter gelatinilyticus]